MMLDMLLCEETPDFIRAFVKQRTRWQQGFLQVLWKGTWLALPKFRQRLLALYTLSFPYVQALLMLMLPLNIVEMLFLKVSGSGSHDSLHATLCAFASMCC